MTTNEIISRPFCIYIVSLRCQEIVAHLLFYLHFIAAIPSHYSTPSPAAAEHVFLICARCCAVAPRPIAHHKPC